jgi:hypothetical protein
MKRLSGKLSPRGSLCVRLNPFIVRVVQVVPPRRFEVSFCPTLVEYSTCRLKQKDTLDSLQWLLCTLLICCFYQLPRVFRCLIVLNNDIQLTNQVVDWFLLRTTVNTISFRQEYRLERRRSTEDDPSNDSASFKDNSCSKKPSSAWSNLNF